MSIISHAPSGWEVQIFRNEWAQNFRNRHELLSVPARLDAWNGLRAIRITMQAACAGWIPEEDAWALCAVVARELQHTYGGFGPLTRAYQDAFRAWAPRGSEGAQQECARRDRAIERMDASGWRGVDFAQDLTLPGSQLRDLASIAWLVERYRAEHAPTRVAAKSPPLSTSPVPPG